MMQNEVEEFTPVILSKMDPGITGSFGFLPGTIEARAIAIVPPGVEITRKNRSLFNNLPASKPAWL